MSHGSAYQTIVVTSTEMSISYFFFFSLLFLKTPYFFETLPIGRSGSSEPF
jgi:hypothetical protein